MTSSLVGSEMCIRDSLSPPSFPRLHYTFFPPCSPLLSVLPAIAPVAWVGNTSSVGVVEGGALRSCSLCGWSRGR
eukprot:9729927-Prorocentrum_lima.AAC.1